MEYICKSNMHLATFFFYNFLKRLVESILKYLFFSMATRIFTHGYELYIPFEGSTTTDLMLIGSSNYLRRLPRFVEEINCMAKQYSIAERVNVFIMNFKEYVFFNV